MASHAKASNRFEEASIPKVGCLPNGQMTLSVSLQRWEDAEKMVHCGQAFGLVPIICQSHSVSSTADHPTPSAFC